MCTAIEEFPKGRQFGKNDKEHEGNATKDEEDDLRIMQHFVRGLIERSQ